MSVLYERWYGDESMPLDVTRNGVSKRTRARLSAWARFVLSIQRICFLKVRKGYGMKNQGKDKKWKLIFPSALSLLLSLAPHFLGSRMHVHMQLHICACCISTSAPTLRLILTIFHALIIGILMWMDGMCLYVLPILFFQFFFCFSSFFFRFKFCSHSVLLSIHFF